MDLSCIKRLSLILIPIGLLLVSVGCSANVESETVSNNGNLTTLESVIENTFTGPNQELNALLSEPENATIIGHDKETKSPAQPTELEVYLEEMYKPHFTEDMYDEFLDEITLYYHASFLARPNIKTEVDSIDFKQNESEKNIYDFTTNVTFQNEGLDPKIYEVIGQANFTEEGKIAKLIISDDNGLSMILREK